jgi:hypothetical protein
MLEFRPIGKSIDLQTLDLKLAGQSLSLLFDQMP